MRRIRSRLAVLSVVLAASLVGGVVSHAQIDPTSITVQPFDKLVFKKQPNGAETATVFGDSSKPGIYGLVFKFPPHLTTRPHSHPNDRYITVLSGTWYVATGPKYLPETMVAMKPGAIVTDLAGQIHYDGTKDEPTMIYIVGMGPAPSIPREEK